MIRIEELIARLQSAGLAEMGRPGLIEGTRELIEPPYIIVYKVIETRHEIVIVLVIHSAQNR